MSIATAQQLKTQVSFSINPAGSPFAVPYDFNDQSFNGEAVIGKVNKAAEMRAATAQLQNQPKPQPTTQSAPPPRRTLGSAHLSRHHRKGRNRYDVLVKQHASAALARVNKTAEKMTSRNSHPSPTEVINHMAKKPVAPPTVSMPVDRRALVRKIGYAALKAGAKSLAGPAAGIVADLMLDRGSGTQELKMTAEQVALLMPALAPQQAIKQAHREVPTRSAQPQLRRQFAMPVPA